MAIKQNGTTVITDNAEVPWARMEYPNEWTGDPEEVILIGTGNIETTTGTAMEFTGASNFHTIKYKTLTNCNCAPADCDCRC